MKNKIKLKDIKEFADKYCFDIKGFDKSSFVEETILSKKKAKDRKKIISVKKCDRIEKRWYESLDAKNPDYSVYNDISILQDIWACWAVCSRIYINYIFTRKIDGKIISDYIGKINSVLDIGNGIGYSTAYLKQSFPKANVLGYNIKDSFQYKICVRVAKDYGFKMIHDLNKAKNIDLLFASEYFEHFERPIDHLQEVLFKTNPKTIIVANAFGTKSIGHFNSYINNVSILNPKKIRTEFNKVLVRKGYTKLKSTCWNDRPNIWKKLN